VTRTDTFDPGRPEGSELSEETVRGALRGVVDPELGADIIELGMVTSVRIDDGAVEVGVALTVAGCPLRTQIQSDVETHVGGLPGVRSVS
jgi:ATP-binding protein involved in chromosome partitioning